MSGKTRQSLADIVSELNAGLMVHYAAASVDDATVMQTKVLAQVVPEVATRFFVHVADDRECENCNGTGANMSGDCLTCDGIGLRPFSDTPERRRAAAKQRRTSGSEARND